MPPVKELIEQANRRTRTARNRTFVKKSSDAQMLDYLTKCAEVAVNAHKQCHEKGLPVMDSNLYNALKELGSAVSLAKRRMQ